VRIFFRIKRECSIGLDVPLGFRCSICCDIIVGCKGLSTYGLTLDRQTYVAQVCNVAANKVVSKVKRLGGGFGGKETRSIQLTGIVALAAKKTGRPVRCMLNRDEDMITSGQRHPFLARWKVGVNKDGKLQALDADVFCNAGWSQDLSAAVCDRALSHIGMYSPASVTSLLPNFY
jgi:xanthine dehydrogenase molybdopterin-binding subunit B